MRVVGAVTVNVVTAIVSAFYSSFEHGCFAFITIGFVSFLRTIVSPSFAFMLTILSISVSFAIELLLEVVLFLEPLVASGFVRLNLSQVSISHVDCWSPSYVSIRSLLDV